MRKMVIRRVYHGECRNSDEVEVKMGWVHQHEAGG